MSNTSKPPLALRRLTLRAENKVSPLGAACTVVCSVGLLATLASTPAYDGLAPEAVSARIGVISPCLFLCTQHPGWAMAVTKDSSPLTVSYEQLWKFVFRRRAGLWHTVSRYESKSTAAWVSEQTPSTFGVSRMSIVISRHLD